jgi:hypothetical protein
MTASAFRYAAAALGGAALLQSHMIAARAQGQSAPATAPPVRTEVGFGGSIMAPGPTVAGGMVFVGSGYSTITGQPGNVLFAFCAARVVKRFLGGMFPQIR